MNTFLDERDAEGEHAAAPLFRATEEEQRAQVAAVQRFPGAPRARSARGAAAAAGGGRGGGNVFAELLETVQVCSLGQISRALYEVGGQYRRHM